MRSAPSLLQVPVSELTRREEHLFSPTVSMQRDDLVSIPTQVSSCSAGVGKTGRGAQTLCSGKSRGLDLGRRSGMFASYHKSTLRSPAQLYHL